ncbi:MAG: hypothetical protein QNL04_05750 [SAR324 cluster bacterium]|nr:hypothetical protein [SAR324 cluster bacterium]
MITHDFSDLSDANIEFAENLLLRSKALCKNQGDQFELVTEYRDIIASKPNVHDYIFDFWRDFSLAYELVIKATGLKAEVCFFKKNRRIAENYNQSEWGFNLTARNNRWLENEFNRLQITHTRLLNTGTLVSVTELVTADLVQKSILTEDESDSIKGISSRLADLRRNADSHFYFKIQRFMDNDDLTKEYLPILNSLIGIYQQL